jgi:hypothetical protein
MESGSLIPRPSVMETESEAGQRLASVFGGQGSVVVTQMVPSIATDCSMQVETS